MELDMHLFPPRHEPPYADVVALSAPHRDRAILVKSCEVMYSTLNGWQILGTIALADRPLGCERLQGES